MYSPLLRACGSAPIPAEIRHSPYGSLPYRRNMFSSPRRTLPSNAWFGECRTASRCLVHLLVPSVSTPLQPRTVFCSIIRLRRRQQWRTLSRNTFRFRLYQDVQTVWEIHVGDLILYYYLLCMTCRILSGAWCIWSMRYLWQVFIDGRFSYLINLIFCNFDVQY